MSVLKRQHDSRPPQFRRMMMTCGQQYKVVAYPLPVRTSVVKKLETRGCVCATSRLANRGGRWTEMDAHLKASFRRSDSQGFELAARDEQTHQLFPSHKSPRALCQEYNIKIEEDPTSASQLTEKAKKGDIRPSDNWFSDNCPALQRITSC